jgi:hypothetical protein
MIITFIKNISHKLFSAIIFLGALAASETWAQPLGTVEIGDPSSTANNYTLPVNNYYNYSYSQQIILASQINKPLGGTITKIRFYWTGGSLSMANSDNWTISFGQTNKTMFNSTTDWIPVANLSQVYQGTITTGGVNGWVELVLNTPFNYNGTSNLVIASREVQSGYPGTTRTFRTTSTNATSRSMSYYSDNTSPNATNLPTATEIFNYYNNVQLDFMVHPNNVGLDAFINPTHSNFCSGPQEVAVKVHNYGNNDVNTVTVNWSINDVIQTPIQYNNTIGMENTTNSPDATIVLGTHNFEYNTLAKIKAWTSMPNGFPDTDNQNDMDSVLITPNKLGINDFSIIHETATICEGSSVLLDAGTHPKNPVYIWSDAHITRTIEATAAGIYWVKVENEDGCYATDTVLVSYNANPSIGNIAIVNDGQENFTFNVIGAVNVDSYVWDFDDNTTQSGIGIPGAVTHSFAEPRTYNVTLTVTNECKEVTSSTLVQVFGTTGLEDLSINKENILIYPNPATKIVTIKNKGTLAIDRISVVDIMGRTIQSIPVTTNELQINLNSINAGIYSIILHTDKGNLYKKLEVIKQ